MLATRTLDKLHALKLPAMAQAWTEQQQNPAPPALRFDERLGLLVALWGSAAPDRNAARCRRDPEAPRAPGDDPLRAEPRPTRARRRRALIGSSGARRTP